METEARLSVHDINELAREHTPGHYLFERQQVEKMRESLARYGVALAGAESRMGVMMTRLLRVAEVHDAALARKDYAVSDAIRQALDISPPFETTPASRRAAYSARFDVPAKKRMVNFLAMPSSV